LACRIANAEQSSQSYICKLTRSIALLYYRQSTASNIEFTYQEPYVTMPEVYAAPPDYAFPRNFKGYGEKGLEGLKWPNDAKIAVSFVINYEEVSKPAGIFRILILSLIVAIGW
jgi:hypothetical protein